jgi:hypothetical protein
VVGHILELPALVASENPANFLPLEVDFLDPSHLQRVLLPTLTIGELVDFLPLEVGFLGPSHLQRVRLPTLALEEPLAEPVCFLPLDVGFLGHRDAIPKSLRPPPKDHQ